MVSGESFRKKRPDFEQFKTLFMEEVIRCTNSSDKNTFRPWLEVGNESLRQEIINSFVSILVNRYGVTPVLDEPLSSLDSPIESVINRIYHVFSTMFLVEHINEKMYGKRG